MESERVKELAETLKKQGLAASTYEAIEKAKRIVGDEEKIEEVKEERERTKRELEIKVEKQKLQEEKEKESFFEKIKDKLTHKEQEDIKRFEQPDYDVSREEVTVNELMEEIGVNPEAVKETEKEKIIEETEPFKDGIREEEVKVPETQNISDDAQMSKKQGFFEHTQKSKIFDKTKEEKKEKLIEEAETLKKEVREEEKEEPEETEQEKKEKIEELKEKIKKFKEEVKEEP